MTERKQTIVDAEVLGTVVVFTEGRDNMVMRFASTLGEITIASGPVNKVPTHPLRSLLYDAPKGTHLRITIEIEPGDER
jgi:hypothetical protein